MDRACSQCLEQHLRDIAQCGPTSTAEPLDKAIIGLWRSPSGLTMLLVENTKGFYGYAYHLPGALTKSYQHKWRLLAKLTKKPRGGYQGEFLSPSGKWLPVLVELEGRSLRTAFPQGATINWAKTVRIKQNSTGPGSLAR